VAYQAIHDNNKEQPLEQYLNTDIEIEPNNPPKPDVRLALKGHHKIFSSL